MSPEEKETKISDLSSQVRELMDAGRYDDALDLLTEGLTEEKRQEIIDILFGDEDERKKYNLREREKKMNDRIKNGKKFVVFIFVSCIFLPVTKQLAQVYSKLLVWIRYQRCHRIHTSLF